MIYLIVLILLLILSVRYDINGKTRGRDQWYKAMLIAFILIAGLRYRFAVDTIGYIYAFYYNTPLLWDLDFTELDTFKMEPLWVLLNSAVKSFGGKFFVVQLIQASIVDILIFRYIKKHSNYPFLCVTLFFIMDYHYFTMMIMRNAIGIAICLFANDYVIEKKWRKAFLLYSIAVLFHYSTALIMLITPFLMFLRLNKVGVLLLLSMLIVGKVVMYYFGDIFALLEFSSTISGKLDSYLENGMLGADDKNINFFLFSVFLPFAYSIASLYFVKRFMPQSSLLRLEPFVMIGLMFIMLRFNIGMLHRFTRLYSVYFIMFYVQSFMYMCIHRGILERSLAFTRSLIAFSPFLFTTLYLAMKGSGNYYPYYTVIEKKVDKAREKHFLESRPYMKYFKDSEY